MQRDAPLLPLNSSKVLSDTSTSILIKYGGQWMEE